MLSMACIGGQPMLRRPSFVVPCNRALRVEADDLAFRISQEWFDSIVYFYPDSPRAEAGEQMGGTGFLLGWPMPNGYGATAWVVTNKHIIEQAHWTVRINTKGGGFACIDTDDREWICCPNSDLAVRPIKLCPDVHQFTYLLREWLLTKEWYEALDIGPGDECITIGRFVGHGGRSLNLPAARFGQISQSPKEPVFVDNKPQECFLVESRSIGGTSGSPVYVKLDPGSYRRTIDGNIAPDGTVLRQDKFPTKPLLLGVCFAMVPSWQSICDQNYQEVQNGWRVQLNTGMMGVVPAWHLHDFMDSGEASEVRKVLEDSILEEMKRLNMAPTVSFTA
jgi:hypothetical protein